MHREPTIQDVLNAVSGLSSHMDREFLSVREEMGEMKRDIRAEMATKTDLAEMESKLRKELASKSDLAEMKGELRKELASKTDLAEMKGELITHIDVLAIHHNTLDVELAALRSRSNRQDTFLHKVAKKLDLEYEPN